MKIDGVDIEQIKKEIKKANKAVKDAFNPNDITGIKINGIEVVIKDIKGYSKEIEKLVAKKEQLNKFKNNDLENQISLPKINSARKVEENNENASLPNDIDNNVQIEPKEKSLNLWDVLKQKIQAVKPCIETFRASLFSLGSNKELELIKYKISEIEEKLQNAKEGKIHLSTKEVIETEAELEKLNSKKRETEDSGKGNAFSNMLGSIKKIMPNLGTVSGVISKIKDKFGQWGSGLKNGLSHIFSYIGSLISVHGILSKLGSFSSNWLSSQNSEAQQLSANIEYMKYSMGSIFAGAIQYVINLVYQLMKAMQSVVYAFSGVNIFAKATATSMKNTAGSAKSMSRSLDGIHNEINNVSNDTSVGGGNPAISSPDIDLSQIDNQMSPLAQKLYDFFKPLKESWDVYGPELLGQIKMAAGQTGYMISSVWGSFENIITNGTIYTSLELIFSIIGNIAEKFANAWNYNGNGDVIVQSLANAFNNLLGAIDNVVKNDTFQEFLNNCSDKFKIIAEKIESIDWQPMVDALTNIGATIGSVALDVLSGLVEIFKFFVEHPDIAGIIANIAISLLALGSVISVISGILKLYEITESISKILKISILTIISTIGAIILVVTGVVSAISSFISILTEGFSWLKEIIMLVGIAITAIGTIILGAPAMIAIIVATIVAIIANAIILIKEHGEMIWTFVSNIGNAIWNFIINVCSIIQNIIINFILILVERIVAFFTAIWEIISLALESIKTIWNLIWENMKNKVLEIWQNIKTSITEKIDTLKNNVSNILNNISTIWTSIFSSIKTSTTNIFNGIWEFLKGIINNILGGIEGMANGVVKGINTVINAMNKLKFNIPDWVPELGGKTFGFNIPNVNMVSLPRLKTGSVLYEETAFIGGEYSGARSNPEIVSPVNLIYETQKRAIEDSNFGEAAGDMYFTVKVGDNVIGEVCLDSLRRIKRQTGKEIEVLCS
jgi:hypothetical protein